MRRWAPRSSGAAGLRNPWPYRFRLPTRCVNAATICNTPSVLARHSRDRRRCVSARASAWKGQPRRLAACGIAGFRMLGLDQLPSEGWRRLIASPKATLPTTSCFACTRRQIFSSSAIAALTARFHHSRGGTCVRAGFWKSIDCSCLSEHRSSFRATQSPLLAGLSLEAELKACSSNL
jgi:hypothetical protein